MLTKEIIKERSYIHHKLDMIRDSVDKCDVTNRHVARAKKLTNRIRCQCIDCHRKLDFADDFMVKDLLWAETVGPENVVLCLKCFQRLLGRKVIERDLKTDRSGKPLAINLHLLQGGVKQADAKIIPDDSELAIHKQQNEAHYAGLLEKALTPSQRRTLKREEERKAREVEEAKAAKEREEREIFGEDDAED